MIRVEKLIKRYGSFEAVHGVDFNIEQGEVVGLLGPNGAGKTTIIKILTCYMPASEGIVEIDGLNPLEDSLKIREMIGYLPETTPLYLDMNVVDYLFYMGSLRRMEKNHLKNRVQEMIEVCKLSSQIKKNIGELSKGYRQRVGLAQAMLHDPSVLILDEPISGLDPNQIVEIRNLIKQLGEKKTVIFSTHILSEAALTCSRAIIINKGNIVASGSVEQLQRKSFPHQNVWIELSSSGEKLRAVISQNPKIHISNEERTPNLRLQIRGDHDYPLREKLFEMSIKEGETIMELYQEEYSLEDVFRSLTSGQEEIL